MTLKQEETIQKSLTIFLMPMMIIINHFIENYSVLAGVLILFTGLRSVLSYRKLKRDKQAGKPLTAQYIKIYSGVLLILVLLSLFFFDMI